MPCNQTRIMLRSATPIVTQLRNITSGVQKFSFKVRPDKFGIDIAYITDHKGDAYFVEGIVARKCRPNREVTDYKLNGPDGKMYHARICTFYCNGEWEALLYDDIVEAKPATTV